MTDRHIVFPLILVALVACSDRGRRRDRTVRYEEIDYPPARAGEQVDELHGKKVHDPYRWLEDPDSAETKEWIDAEANLTEQYLDSIRERKRIRARLEELLDFERVGVPMREGGRYFFRRNTGLQDQAVLLVADALDAEPRVLLDPNTLSEDGTLALSRIFPSPNGRHLCYSLSQAGSDWREFRVRHVESGNDLAADRLKWIKFSNAAWARDSSGFYYRRMPAPEEGKELTAETSGGGIWFHRLGTGQDSDELVWERPDHPKWSLGSSVSEDGRYLVLYAFDGSAGHNAVFLRDLEQGGEVQPIADDFAARVYVLGNVGTQLYLFTDRDAPNGRIVRADAGDPDPANWTDVVPEGKYSIEDSLVAGGRLVIHTLRRAHSEIKVYRLDGALERELALPGLGSAFQFNGHEGDPELFFGFTGFTHPATAMRCDLEGGAVEAFRRPEVDFDPGAFTVRQVAYRSKDGTYVTMFIVHRKGIPMDGRNPTLLTGYGGFNVSMQPYFSTSNVVWMEMGGVFALPNLRGGGEYGERWHRAGMREHKQNVFDDFIAAAEALVRNGYTSSHHLAIEGGSNGGLLVGACMTQRPELFGACLAEVGVMDMLRYHTFTVGYAWTGEYGSADDPAMFPVLLAYSPYHNLRPGVAYPATLVSTADHDDRVVPAHSFKFAARLQACQAGPAPVLIRIERESGHGAGTPTSKRLDARADQFAFLVRNLGMRLPRRLGR